MSRNPRDQKAKDFDRTSAIVEAIKEVVSTVKEQLENGQRSYAFSTMDFCILLDHLADRIHKRIK